MFPVPGVFIIYCGIGFTITNRERVYQNPDFQPKDPDLFSWHYATGTGGNEGTVPSVSCGFRVGIVR